MAHPDSRLVLLSILACAAGQVPAATYDPVWQLGSDDNSTAPFSQESFGPNSAPGSASVKDDDYYFAGTYPGVGTVASAESLANFERAASQGDPRKRVHFMLSAAQAASSSRLKMTVDLFGGGAWISQSIPGFSSHDISITFNGQPVGTRNGITWNTLLSFTVPASAVNAVAGANVLQIERTGGSNGGYIQLDYLKLEVDPDALSDADGDGLPLWFEEDYELNPALADATLDTDGDGLTNLQEFQAGTNPTDPDTDNDGLTDAQEITTNPLKRDTDGDGLADGEETGSSPLLIDTDNDSYPDNVELEQGSDPNSDASRPFNFPNAVSLQFISEAQSSAALPVHEPAGYFRLPWWNVTPWLPAWRETGTTLTGSMTALKNHRGLTTSIGASWTYHYAQDGLHKGPGNERLYDGMIRSENNGSVVTPATVTLSNIPYATYDLLVYVGAVYPDSAGDSAPNRRIGYVQRGSDAASKRYFGAASAPPFHGFIEATSTTDGDYRPANYVRYPNLSGSTQTVSVQSPPVNTPACIHGIQIIDTLTDSDNDGMKDATEVEFGFNPLLPDANADADGDGMSNSAEIAAGCDPHDRDTDKDGLLDGEEAAYGTSPLDPDSDNDTLTDGAEVHATPFNSLPTSADSDGDGYSDAVEHAIGSNPMSATNFPPSVPQWDAATNTWRWRIDNIRLLWNHSQSMLGAIPNNDAMLCEAVATINGGGWNHQIGIGLAYSKGKLMHRFRCIQEVFHQANGDGYWDTDFEWDGVTDHTKTYGFSGFGEADDSKPLRMEFTAVRAANGSNSWTLKFLLADLSNPNSPVTLATYSAANAIATDPSLMSGNTVWTDANGNPGHFDLAIEPGVQAFITPTAVGVLDTDSDGMPDAWETANSFNPNSASDANLDADGDGLSNLREFLAGTFPRDSDSDDDGANDGLEINYGSDPLAAASRPAGFNFTGNLADLNGDGLSDAWTLWAGGTPRAPLADDDGDGMSNLSESQAGTDPGDPNSRITLTGTIGPSGFDLAWTDLPFKAHAIEKSDALTGWSTVGGTPTVSGGLRRLTIPSNQLTPSKGFYRATVNPIDSDGDGVEDWVEAKVLGTSTSSATSAGQTITRANGQSLSGDAVALLERMQGAAVNGGSPGTTTPDTPSATNAARFLMQASFGPVPQDIAQVRALGYAGWIDQQIAAPPSYLSPYIKQIKADAAGSHVDPTYNFNQLDKYVFGNNMTTPFARAAIGGEDQLRQRVAFALSQILVVSRRDANLEDKPEGMANYYDMLIRNSLGNYGDLLREVAMHPAMGWYLSHAGNQKADPSIPRYPDENFARELMQLFSIGLWELNPDGSRKLDIHGEPIPTYDNGGITEMARVFTGLYFASPYGWGGGGWEDSHLTLPMVMYPERHDFGVKHIPGGFVVPAREENETNGLQDVRDAVEAMFRHPNTPTFVGRQLIQFLVTDNPSPAYVKRVHDVFVNDGTGKRGNLAAVVKTILLDPEARSQPASPTYGKVREPVIRTMHLGRIFKLAEAHPDFVWWNWPENYYGYTKQEPLNSPSVFNFYTPVYQAPGEIRNSGLVSPGFQIVDTFSSISFPNLAWDYLHRGFTSAWEWNYPLDYSGALLLAENPAALVDHMNLLICAGSMTTRTRGIIVNAISNSALTAKDRVALAAWLAMCCPEGSIQR
ncbi:DUF1800 family protein [Haloferula sp. BvORR071]|uniref:DUF1800 domain-containing protein n=1 Tax=Haloferula sp. BvORR071 TaxID=1396141 RepID=UPI002240EF13|nr:DUF1800 family protein [Haloferula sp. BvORR071]